LIGIAETVEREEIEPFEEKFKVMVEYLYQNGWITEREYRELLEVLNQSKSEEVRRGNE